MPASRFLGPRARRAWIAFAAVWLVYHANMEPLVQIDCVAAPYVAWSLVKHGSADVGHYPELRNLFGNVVKRSSDGRWMSQYPPGSSLVAIPFVLPFALIRDTPLDPAGMQHLGKLVAATCSAAAVALFFSICLAWAPGSAILATLLFALGSELWTIGSQGLWQHGPATLWLTLALHGLIGRGPSPAPARHRVFRCVWTGAALGLAVLTRPTTAIFAAATLMAFAWRGAWRDALATTLGLAPPLVFLLLWNEIHSESPLMGVYGSLIHLWTMPLHVGLAGLLVAPSRGLLVYTPALLLVPMGIAALLRDRRTGSTQVRVVWIAWLLASVATLVLYARFSAWWGGWCFGPRYLIETLPILCLCFALGVANLRSQKLRGLAWALVSLSIGVQVLGVFGDDGGAWNARHPNGPVFDVRDTQIEAHLRQFLGAEAAAHRSAGAISHRAEHRPRGFLFREQLGAAGQQIGSNRVYVRGFQPTVEAGHPVRLEGTAENDRFERVVDLGRGHA